MKILKQIYLPALIVLIGAGAAFATNTAKHSEMILEPGYYFDSTQPVVKCIQTPEQCETTGVETCTWTDEENSITHELSQEVNQTMCGQQLFKP